MGERLFENFKLYLQDGEPVAFGVNRFPDGQIQFFLDNGNPSLLYDLVCSLTTPEDVHFFQQLRWTIALDKVKITYLYGARSDKGQAGKRLVCNVAGMMLDFLRPGSANGLSSPQKVEIVAPHCQDDVKEFSAQSRPDYITASYPIHPGLFDNLDIVLFPDRSAQIRYAPFVPASLRQLVCEKERDQISGEIIRHEIPGIRSDQRILVMDDLCDGGASFLDISAIAREAKPKRLDLYVTHGVFSRGEDALLGHYDQIFTTNSYRPERSLNLPATNVLDVWAI